jgi:hypothetical protein
MSFAEVVNNALDEALKAASPTPATVIAAPGPTTIAATPTAAAAAEAAAPTTAPTAAATTMSSVLQSGSSALARVLSFWSGFQEYAIKYGNTEVVALTIIFFLTVLILYLSNPPFVQQSVPNQHPLQDGPVSPKAVFICGVIMVLSCVLAPILWKRRQAIGTSIENLFFMRFSDKNPSQIPAAH